MRHLYTKFGHAEQLVAKAMDGGLGVELVALQARHARRAHAIGQARDH